MAWPGSTLHQTRGLRHIVAIRSRICSRCSIKASAIALLQSTIFSLLLTRLPAARRRPWRVSHSLLCVHGSQCPSLAGTGGRGNWVLLCICPFLTLAEDIQGLLEGFEPVLLRWSLSRDQPDSEWKAHKALGGGLATLVGGGNIILGPGPAVIQSGTTAR